MPDIFTLLGKWWKQILGVMIIATVTIGVICFLKPKLYLSSATAVPASSFASDKNAIFNQNIQALYTSLGEPDDLDRVLGTAALDTIYIAVGKQLSLYAHYKISDDSDGDAQLAASIKKNSKVSKTGYGELKVKAWDGDKELAAQLANAIMQQLQIVHQNLNSISNEYTLQGLQEGRKKIIDEKDSLASNTGRAGLLEEYNRLINQYRLMVSTKPPALIVVEHAKPSAYPDKPRILQTLVAAAILSFIFSLLSVLIIEGRKSLAT